MKKLIPFITLMIFTLLCYSVAAETVYLEASLDNTIIESEDGTLSNGSGPTIFAGRTNQPANSIRRGAIYFDVASAIPADAVVQSVSLTLFMTKANSINQVINLHRLKRDWGEGASSSGGGQGAPAQPGDATWIHSIYPDEYWSRDGGLFSGSVSASMMVGDVTGPYTWESTKRLVQDVESWLKDLEKNSGWIIIGNEDEPQTVVPFASRENSDPLKVPLLEVVYSLPDGM